MSVDAIVNAAKESLIGGCGVDGAIHEAAGPELLDACIALGSCPTGDARITPGFRLPARFVIHTVGPVWHGGTRGEPEILASCYRRSLELARDRQLDTIAFSCVATGAHGYPPELAAPIAVSTIADFLDDNAPPQRVYLCAFDPRNMRALERALRDRGP